MIRALWKWLRGWLRGGPHFVVGGSDRPYLRRWYLLPRNPLFNVYLHQFLRDDDDRAMHDHPWHSASLLLAGNYVEETPKGRRLLTPGAVMLRPAGGGFRHRVELPGGKPAWTLFITGPRVRDWGFWCPKKWVRWQDFVAKDDMGSVGRGCGDGRGSGPPRPLRRRRRPVRGD